MDYCLQCHMWMFGRCMDLDFATLIIESSDWLGWSNWGLVKFPSAKKHTSVYLFLLGMALTDWDCATDGLGGPSCVTIMKMSENHTEPSIAEDQWTEVHHKCQEAVQRPAMICCLTWVDHWLCPALLALTCCLSVLNPELYLQFLWWCQVLTCMQGHMQCTLLAPQCTSWCLPSFLIYRHFIMFAISRDWTIDLHTFHAFLSSLFVDFLWHFSGCGCYNCIAYINTHRRQHARQALGTLDFTELDIGPCDFCVISEAHCSQQKLWLMRNKKIILYVRETPIDTIMGTIPMAIIFGLSLLVLMLGLIITSSHITNDTYCVDAGIGLELPDWAPIWCPISSMLHQLLMQALIEAIMPNKRLKSNKSEPWAGRVHPIQQCTWLMSAPISAQYLRKLPFLILLLT